MIELDVGNIYLVFFQRFQFGIFIIEKFRNKDEINHEIDIVQFQKLSISTPRN